MNYSAAENSPQELLYILYVLLFVWQELKTHWFKEVTEVLKNKPYISELF